MIKYLMLILFGMSSLKAELVFQTPPENFQPKVEVAACFIKVGDHFLFLKRHPLKNEGNTWGIPGGKIDQGEEAGKGVVREIQEETRMDLSKASMKHLGTVYIRYPRGDFIYHMFETALSEYPENVIINPVEHTEYRWMTLLEALDCPLIPGEDECIFLVYGEEFYRISLNSLGLK